MILQTWSCLTKYVLRLSTECLVLTFFFKGNYVACFSEAWVQSVDLSGWQVLKDAGGMDPETKPQATTQSTVLPGSVIDYSEDVQEHPSCVIESVVVEDTPEEGE